MRTAFSSSYCLHPEATKDKCRGDISRAHSVSLSALKTIAHRGHVYRLGYGTFKSLEKNRGLLVPELIGINEASTFTGFCNHHDNDTFGHVDNHPFYGSSAQVFLLGYRALCYEIFLKKSIVSEHSQSAKIADNFPPHIAPYFAVFNLEMGRIQDKGLQKLLQIKYFYDKSLLASKWLESLAIIFSGKTDILCSGVFYPQYDLHGNYLQNIATSKWEDCALISYSLLPSKNGVAAVFSWAKAHSSICSSFVRSMIDRYKAQLPSLLVFLVFNFIGNTYIIPRWWKGIDRHYRDLLIRQYQFGAGISRSPEDLSNVTDLGLDWRIEEMIARFLSKARKN